MAFTKTPTSWIPSWSEDATNITVPLASLGLTAAKADAATGDIREIVFAFLNTLADAWYDTAIADRPTYMTINRSVSADNTTGMTTNQFTVTIKTVVSAQDVATEPV